MYECFSEVPANRDGKPQIKFFWKRSVVYSRLIYLISFVLALSLVGSVQAQTATWTDAAPGDHLWSTPENWSEFPTPAHWAKVRNGLPGPTIASDGALASRVHVGYAEGGALTMDGGTLEISGDDLLIAKQDGSGILNMISGSIDVYRDDQRLCGQLPGGPVPAGLCCPGGRYRWGL